MATIPDTVAAHLVANWNGAIVCGSGVIPTIDVWGPEDIENPRDYAEVVLISNEQKVPIRRYQQNLLEDRYYRLNVMLRLEAEAANTKTILDTCADEVTRILGIQVAGFDPGQWFEGPSNLTQTKGFYEKRWTLYLPQYGVSVSSGWTAVGTTSGYQNIIPATDSTYDLGSSTKLWHRLYVDHILSDGAIELLPSGDTDDYLRLQTGVAIANVPEIKVIGGYQLLVSTDHATAAGFYVGETATKSLVMYWAKDALIASLYSGYPIKITPDNDVDDYWYFTTAANIASFLPVEDKTHLIGSAAKSADNVYADDFTNTSPYLRDATALTHLRAITDVDTTHLDYSSLPAWVRQVHRTTPGGAKDAYPPDNPNVFSVNRMAVLTWQAVQQLADQVDQLGGGTGSFFKTIHTEGQEDVVADMDDDTLTLVAGTNITITHDAPNDAITISAAGGGGSTDLVFDEDFFTGSTETGEVGSLGWSFTNGSMVVANAEANHPGVITRRCGTTAAQVASFYPGNAGTVKPLLYSQWTEMTFILAPVATNTDHAVRVGLTSDATSNTPTDGVYFERLAADTNWFRVTRAASSETRNTTSTSYAASWINLRIVKNGSSVEFYVNGSLNGTHTTTIPAAATALLPFVQVIPSSTTARDVKLDALSVTLAAPTR